MLAEPARFLEAYAEAGADAITIHLEAGVHHHRHLSRIRALGARCGLALNPGTPLASAAELLGEIDLLLVMSVNPGYGGQAFIPAALRTIEAAARERDRRGYRFEISVDGGVNDETIGGAAAAGADVLVCGSALFGGDVAANVARLRSALGTES
jgi:ribulose-phosphate 3-epimerase